MLNDLQQDEKLILEALIEARKVQDYIWQDLSLLHKPYDTTAWANVFNKRVQKIYQINSNNPSAKIELRKRVLQQAALSIMALKVLDNQK